MNTLIKYFLAFTFLTITLSCVIPGLSPVQPIPTADTRLDVIIAETVAAAQTQTQQVLPAELATITPTIPPTITSTPRVSVNGTTLVVREDESILFTDYKAGYELTLPVGWLALRINEQEYYDAFTLDVVLQNPLMMERLTQIQSSDPNSLRLDSIDIREGRSMGGMLTIVSVVFAEGNLSSLEELEDEEKDRYNPFTGYKYIGSSYSQTSNGIKILIMEQSWNGRQEGTTSYQRSVFLNLPTGTLVFFLYTNLNLKGEVVPEFEQVINSLKILNP